MSTDDDAPSRLSQAIDEVFATSGPTLPPRQAATTSNDERGATPETRSVPTTEHYAIPEIVPATSDAPAVDRETAPAESPETDPWPDTVVTPPAPSPPAQAPATQAPMTSWSDHMAPLPAGAHGQPLRTPGRRPRVRRVTRVIRHIDPWSTFKVGLLFSAVAYVVGLTAGVLLWQVADNTGTLDNVERWFTQFGWETFEFDGGEIFHNAWILGLFGVVALTGAIVLLATLFNLVSDIVGGVRVTVLEEEVVERTVSSTRRYVVRRPPAAGAAESGSSEATSWSVDDDDDDLAGDVDDDVAAGASPRPTGAAPTSGPDAVTADWSVD